MRCIVEKILRLFALFHFLRLAFMAACRSCSVSYFLRGMRFSPCDFFIRYYHENGNLSTKNVDKSFRHMVVYKNEKIVSFFH